MNVLVRMPNWLGDAVMATPALANLTARCGAERLVLACSPLAAEMLAGAPCRAVVAHPREGRGPGRLASTWRLGRRLRREFGPFDLGVALATSLSTRLLLQAAGAARRAGGHVAGSGSWTGLLLTQRVALDGRLHVAEHYNAVVNACLDADAPAGPTWLPPREQPAPGRGAVGINPGATYGSAKRWRPDRFAEVAAALAESRDIVILGGPAERQIGGEIAAGLRRRGVRNFRNLAGRTSVGQLQAVLSRLSLLVTNDSGPMHIANAYGTPLVAIFGSTDHHKTRPWRREGVEIVRRELPCAPCMKRTCPLGHHACMNDVTAHEVLRAARRLLASDRTAA